MTRRCSTCYFFHCQCPNLIDSSSTKTTIIAEPTRSQLSLSPPKQKISSQETIHQQEELNTIQKEKQYITGSLVYLNQQLVTLQTNLQSISDYLDT